MTTNRLSAVFGLGLATLLGQVPGTPPAHAADPKEVSKDIIAVQIRKQGYACNNPQSAERDTTTGNPDDPVWTLKCEGVSYRVHLVPNMAAKVERLSDNNKQ
jgi:hypothetical protein